MTPVDVTATLMVDGEATPLESLNHLPGLEGWQAHLGGNGHLQDFPPRLPWRAVWRDRLAGLDEALDVSEYGFPNHLPCFGERLTLGPQAGQRGDVGDVPALFRTLEQHGVMEPPPLGIHRNGRFPHASIIAESRRPIRGATATTCDSDSGGGFGGRVEAGTARIPEKRRNGGALSPGVLVVQRTSVGGAQEGVRGSLRAASVRIGPRPATASGDEVGADGLWGGQSAASLDFHGTSVS